MNRRPDAARVASRLAIPATAGLVGALLLPNARWLVASWRISPYYSHGPLVLLVALWLLWTRRGVLAAGQGTVLGLLPLVGGLSLWSLAARNGSPPLTWLAILPIGLGILLLERGWRACRAALWPAILLATAIPVPWVERLGPALAGLVADAAAHGLAALGVPVLRTGALLATADGTFHIGGPCSGLRSTLAMVTLALLAAALMTGYPRRRLLLLMLAAPAALLANWLRLMGLFLSSQYLGAQRAMALYHPIASPLWFLAAAATLFWFAARPSHRPCGYGHAVAQPDP